MKTNVILLSLFALVNLTDFLSQAAAAEPIQCVTNFEARNTNKRPAPGSLATRKDTPCRVSGYVGVFGKGTHQADGFLVRIPPKNGSVTMENASSFIYTPRKGFVGKDLMVIRIKFVNTRGAAVRFAIRVDE